MLYDLLVFLLESHNTVDAEFKAYAILAVATILMPPMLWFIAVNLNILSINYTDWLTGGKYDLPFIMGDGPVQFYKWIGLPIFICSFPLYLILLAGIIIGVSFLAKKVVALNYKLKDKT